jgi:hypothetical protein
MCFISKHSERSYSAESTPCWDSQCVQGLEAPAVSAQLSPQPPTLVTNKLLWNTCKKARSCYLRVHETSDAQTTILFSGSGTHFLFLGGTWWRRLLQPLLPTPTSLPLMEPFPLLGHRATPLSLLFWSGYIILSWECRIPFVIFLFWESWMPSHFHLIWHQIKT